MANNNDKDIVVDLKAYLRANKHLAKQIKKELEQDE